MKNKILIIIFFSFLTVNYAFSQKNENINAAWTKVDSLIKKDLPKSALEIVEQIYTQSKKNKQNGDFVKAIMYKNNLTLSINENAQIEIIKTIRKELETADTEIKPILYLLLGEEYWIYYSSNRWKFQNRSEIIGSDNDDMATWTLNKILSEIIVSYKKALANPEKLFETKINSYKMIMKDADFIEYSPSMLDFVSNMALEMFLNDELVVNKPAEVFNLNDEKYFANAADFSKMNISNYDTTSNVWFMLNIYQNLLKFHLNDVDKKIVTYIDLKRLNFVRENSILPNKDSLYLASLLKMFEYNEGEAWAEVGLALAEYYFDLGNKYDFNLSPEYRWNYKKSMEYIEAVVSKYKKTFSGNNCLVLKNQIVEKNLSFSMENVNIPGEKFEGILSYKNIDKIWFKIVKIDYANYLEQENLLGGKEKLAEYIEKLPIEKTFSVDVKNEGDFQQHSTNVVFDELGEGFYVAMVSAEKQFDKSKNTICIAPFWVSNISYVSQAQNNGECIFYVINRNTGEKIKNAKVNFYREKYDRNLRINKLISIGNGVSNADGKIGPMKIDPMNINVYVDIKKDGDRFCSQTYFREIYNDNKELKKYFSAKFFTDRSLYRPGQTIYFKGLIFENKGDKNYAVSAGKKMKVVLKNSQNQNKSELEVVSNEYGTFSGSFVVPEDGITGNMYISSDFGKTTISVEEYKRPKFFVEMNPVEGEYRFNDEVSVTGKALAYSGNNIDNANFKYRVVRKSSFPFYRWYIPFNVEESQMASGEGKTNEKGEFEIVFKSVPDYSVPKKYSPVFYYTVYVDVTDLNGETRSGVASVAVGEKSLILSADLKNSILSSENKFVKIEAKNLSYQPLSSIVNVEIYELEAPVKFMKNRLLEKPDYNVLSEKVYKSIFPFNEYSDENSMHYWKKKTKVFKKVLNTANEKGFSINEALKNKQGAYLMKLFANDSNGNAIESEYYFSYVDVESHKPYTNSFLSFNLLSDKCEPGEIAQILLSSCENGTSVLFEYGVNNTVISSSWHELNNEQKIFEIPIKEEYRGNIWVNVLAVKHNRILEKMFIIEVPFTNKKLDLKFETFRNKMQPGSEEKWKITIKNYLGEKQIAEMIAAMYDASLDAYKLHDWTFSLFDKNYKSLNWQFNRAFCKIDAYCYGSFNDKTTYYEKYVKLPKLIYPTINTMKSYKGFGSRNFMQNKKEVSQTAFMLEDVVEEKSSLFDDNVQEELVGNDVAKDELRNDFSETAFFISHLESNANGEVEFEFTMPESLTKWKFMALAHTKDMKIGSLVEYAVTQKMLMINSFAPRFLREGDTVTFSAKISNLSESELNGVATLELVDPSTNASIAGVFNLKDPKVDFLTKSGQSCKVEWKMYVPKNVELVKYRVKAVSGVFSDGEENVLPILSNRMLVVESLPLAVRGKQTKNFSFDKLKDDKSKSISSFRYTLEFTSNPVWYAIQALPYMMDYPYECSEQIFSRYYANALASKIANSNPQIKQVFDSWKDANSEALLSNLEKNEELKTIVLEETPWLLDAKDESERKKSLGLLFDLNKMGNELQKVENKLVDNQSLSGGFPWFKGMSDSRYITQLIVSGFGKLERMGVKNERKGSKNWKMLEKAVAYMDLELVKSYEDLKKRHLENMNKQNVGYLEVQYFYARSFFPELNIMPSVKEAYDYYFKQIKKYWTSFNLYSRGMIALSMQRNGDVNTAQDIVKSLKERSLHSEEMGMYWKDFVGGFDWWTAPIESQAMMVEVFNEVAKDQSSIDEMRIWLLKQKQVQSWKTTRATADACYALLIRGTDLVSSSNLVEVKVGGELVSPSDKLEYEAGSGYFKKSWNGKEVNAEMGNISISNSNAGIAWGAAYWQYFEDIDNISSAGTQLNINRKLFVERQTTQGVIIEPIVEGCKLSVGDKVIARIEIRTDRDMEFLHLKDMRASCMEPENVMSRTKYQDGLFYFESTRDAATNFFFDKLPKGTYVFEYPMRITHGGSYSGGIGTIQCMYAPEFSSHSKGLRINVNE